MTELDSTNGSTSLAYVYGGRLFLISMEIIIPFVFVVHLSIKTGIWRY